MTTTTNNRPLRRMLAEWDSAGAVLMAWPHSSTDWAYMLAEAQQCYVGIIRAVTRSGTQVVLLAPDPAEPRAAMADIDPRRLVIARCDTNDTWTRDYGPITVEVDGTPTLLDFRFNGWGMKFAACLDNQVNRRLAAAKVLDGPMECHLDMVLEGGSVETDGRGTLLTTACCLTAPNRNEPMTAAAIEEQLMRRLGVTRVMWLRHGSLMGDDTDGHVDTLARLAPGDTIIYTGAGDPADPQHAPLAAMADEIKALRTAAGLPFNLVELPLPDPVIDENGECLPATYANYLVTARAVIVPGYGQPRNDRLAAQMLRIAFPDHEVTTVDCRPLIRQHGSLHCATMQLYSEI